MCIRDSRDAGDPAELASFYNEQGADELVFLDITASSDARNTILRVVEKVSECVFIPLTVGGGVRSVSDVRKLLEAGADKVSVNTAALTSSQLISEASDRFGIQCIVVAIDARRIVDERRYMISTEYTDQGDVSLNIDSKWEVYTHGGRKATGIDAVKWCRYMATMGAGELLLTSMDADGHEYGYDLDLTSTVSNAVDIPVIASGGAGKPEHLFQVLEQGKADAALAASIFHFGTYSISEVKRYLADNGVPVRPIEDR